MNVTKHTFRLVVQGNQETPQKIWVIATVLGCLPDIEGKSQLLKALCSSGTRLERSEVDLTLRPVP